MDTLVTSKSGKRHIFVIVGRFTKYVRPIAMPETTRTDHVIKLFVDNWVVGGGSTVGPNSVATACSSRRTSRYTRAEGTCRLPAGGLVRSYGGAWHAAFAVRLRSCCSGRLVGGASPAPASSERRRRDGTDCGRRSLARTPRLSSSLLASVASLGEVGAVGITGGARRDRRRERNGVVGTRTRGWGRGPVFTTMMSAEGGGGSPDDGGETSNRLRRRRSGGGRDDGWAPGGEAQRGAEGGAGRGEEGSSSASTSPSSSSGGQPSPRGFGVGVRGGGKNSRKSPPPEALLRAISEVSRSDGRQRQTRNLVLGGGGNETLDNDWERLDSAVNEYPSLRGFTAIGSGGEDFVQSMVGAVESVLQVTLPEQKIQRRLSEKGNFVSVKIGPVKVESGEQVQAVYFAMKQDGRMRYFL
ncbi:hypothetical protein CBR_g57027 [Chara braunii]|uniref:Uncharacterized protein n=1 Tax=Chara braunii TaxID=69332 RepID=A0A388K7V9_CHABU|nr:hypothetical protein CBR_g57027 [Chara braunii]|eukprot:GBG66145.1 hypothetical protein CBR_g57027 [Chara braunii]